MLLMIKTYFSNEGGLIWGGNRALLIKQIKDTQLLVVDKLNDLHIVLEIDLSKLVLKLLGNEVFLFKLEYFLEIKLMEPFIGIVDE